MELDELKKLECTFDLSTLLWQLLLTRAQIEALTDFITKNALKQEKDEINKAIIDKTGELFKNLCETQKEIDDSKKSKTFVDPRI
jgi:hypothetical protein